MKSKMLIWVVPVLLVLLISCGRVTDNSNGQITDNDWLQNLTCTFPCWQNITPQETKFEDVVSILQDANVTGVNENQDHVSFLFEKTISGLVYQASDGSVDSIILDFQQRKLSIGDLEHVIGAPKKISFIRIPNIPYCLVNLLYPDQGIVLEVNLENNGKSNDSLDCQIEIAPKNEVYRMILIGQNLNNNELWKRANSTLSVKEWKGYGEYPQFFQAVHVQGYCLIPHAGDLQYLPFLRDIIQAIPVA